MAISIYMCLCGWVRAYVFFIKDLLLGSLSIEYSKLVNKIGVCVCVCVQARVCVCVCVRLKDSDSEKIGPGTHDLGELSTTLPTPSYRRNILWGNR